jgi:DUF1680 family protein
VKNISAPLYFLCCCITLLLPCLGDAQENKPVNLFPAADVQLLPGLFKDAEQTDLKYMLAMDPDRLLSPYLREAGLVPKAKSYPNWEDTGLDGHMGGHYLSAIAMMFAATGDQQIARRLDYMLDELKRCQDKNDNGYIGGVPGGKQLWKEISDGNIQAGSFDLNKKWVPLYNIHKIYGGLRDAYLYTGKAQAKDMLIKYSNWFIWLSAKLSDQQVQDMLTSEHGGINEVLADVYGITGDKRYLALAYKFSHHKILDPLERETDQLNGIHANTQIPKVIGFKKIADLNKDSLYNKAAHFFWKTVIENRTVANGGNSVREHFNPANDFSSMISSVEGPETCNSYNMLKLTKLLYESDGLPAYIDYYERTLYNHILSSQHPGEGGFVYFTPMRPGHYRVYSKRETSFWCCVGSGLENHAKYNELIYACQGNILYLNLFMASKLNWKEKSLKLMQQTAFPESDKSVLTITEGKPSRFELKLRYPSWVAPGMMQLKINGKSVVVSSDPGHYVSLNRVWKKGDRLEIVLPMQTRTEQLPDGSNYVAVMHGPILLAARTDTTDLAGLYADDSRMGHIAKGRQYPLQDMPIFVSEDKNFADRILPMAGQSLHYTASSLIYPDQYKDLQLEPFYKIHDSRYVIYWQTENKAGLAAMRLKQAAEEKAKADLAALTFDMVFPGEQQPESDHFFRGDESTSGQNRDRHWRAATGWFSYELKTAEKEPAQVRLTYFGKDANRKFKILVNEQEIAQVYLQGKEGDRFYTVDYLIPKSVPVMPDGRLVLKFVADIGSETAGIYEVRLMKLTK